jgi:hypothetical protein
MKSITIKYSLHEHVFGPGIQLPERDEALRELSMSGRYIGMIGRAFDPALSSNAKYALA